MVFLAIAGLLWLGLRNSKDPDWLEAGRLVRQKHLMLDEATDSIQLIYRALHGGASTDSTAMGAFFNTGRSPISWEKFSDFFRKLQAQRFIVLAGVTSTGASKLSTRASLLMGGKADHVLSINCAPQFDLELYKKYIGEEKNAQFLPGELLLFWEKCRANPGERFVALIDNFDKINPETFFGPELWEMLSNPGESVQLGGKKVDVPANFYLISVTHLGPGSHTEFNEEHFKRLGRPYILAPNTKELVEYLRRLPKKLPASDPETPSRLAALRDTAQMHRFIYYFLKTNTLIADRYTAGHQLGQGTNVRNLYRAQDLASMKQTFISHLNALKPERPLAESDFWALDFTVKNTGLAPNSNFLARQVQWLHDTGYFVEVTMVAATALLTALAGWWVFRRREQLIRHYGDRAREIFNNFEAQHISAEEAARQLEEIKHEVDELVLRRKLNYTEALYFMAFIEDKTKRIEFARNVSENFLELFNAFMEDNVLTENEYHKLRQFLETIRHKIPEAVYDQFNNKVKEAYNSNFARTGL